MAKIGLIQVPPPGKLTMQEKYDIMYKLAESCLKEGADIVLFPEAYQYTSYRGIINDTHALNKISGEWQQRLSALAKQYNAYLAPWDYRADKDGKVYNSTYIIDRSGMEIGRYCKCNLTYSEIVMGLTQGCDYPVFDLDFGKVGIMICFDNYFPESAAALGAKGAQLILYPLYGDTLKPQWEMKLRTRAIDHSVFVVSCQLDAFYDIAYTGIVNPEGEVVAKLNEPGTYKVVEIDINRPVITNTMVQPDKCENLKDYLHRCRNYKAYHSLSEQGTQPKDWDEIFIDN